jgi:NAD(P)-dependent dehydrogenase (short-subunit alcohol dehydrogenase family)
MNKLTQRNAIITGGSQGLGRALVEAFVREGANVLFCARDRHAIADLEAQLKASALPGQRIVAQGCDVSSVTEVRDLFAAADECLNGPLHILVNNAGIYGPKGPTDDVDLAEWKLCVDINLYGTLIPCREAMHRFKKSGYGKIVNLSGGGATNPMPNISAYASSKAAVVRLTETLALELQPFHVDVNAVAPGALNTRLLDEVIQAGPEKVGADFYQRSLKQSREGGVPLELGADLCVYLASEESDGVSGKLISAKWDPWKRLHEYKADLLSSDIYALRRITPEDRGKNWPLD